MNLVSQPSLRSTGDTRNSSLSSHRVSAFRRILTLLLLHEFILMVVAKSRRGWDLVESSGGPLRVSVWGEKVNGTLTKPGQTMRLKPKPWWMPCISSNHTALH